MVEEGKQKQKQAGVSVFVHTPPKARVVSIINQVQVERGELVDFSLVLCLMPATEPPSPPPPTIQPHTSNPKPSRVLETSLTNIASTQWVSLHPSHDWETMVGLWRERPTGRNTRIAITHTHRLQSNTLTLLPPLNHWRERERKLSFSTQLV